MARIGEVRGDPNLVLVSTVEGEPLVTLWCGLERTDLAGGCPPAGRLPADGGRSRRAPLTTRPAKHGRFD
jgi:hypothetical protein